jgi:hypothetical protein
MGYYGILGERNRIIMEWVIIEIIEKGILEI